MLRERTETRLLGPQLRTGESFDASDVMAPEIATASPARASVHPQSPAIRYMRELRAGTVWINDPLTDNDAGPFGCFKHSGLGRELGCEGLEAFQETKHVHMETEIERKRWWYPYSEYSTARTPNDGADSE